MGKVAFKFANLCKLIDAVQACIIKKKIRSAKAKAEDRKKALQMLEDEVSDKKKDSKDSHGFQEEEDDEEDDEHSGHTIRLGE